MKTRRRKSPLRKRNRTKRRRENRKNRGKRRSKSSTLVLKNRTPRKVKKLSNRLQKMVDKGDKDLGRGTRSKAVSYAPTINQDLVSLKSMTRADIINCNNTSAFQLKTPLQIAVPGSFFGRQCVPYDHPDARAFLLKNLQANKHITPSKVIPPKQLQSNCWFNSMFVTLFVSDKGRKFFHYFRQLMIEGKQASGKPIPKNLRDAFALLNYSVEVSLTGSRYAYQMDTNSVIKKIYEAIPESYKSKSPYLVEVDKASNPIKYYNSIISYLGDKSLDMLLVPDASKTNDWQKRVIDELKTRSHAPHIIVLEIFDQASNHLDNKLDNFTTNGLRYSLDSSVVRDIQRQHFCATVTCEGKEMGYDGMSFHRMVPMKWKDKINKPVKWQFQGSNNLDGTPLEWSFRSGYQLLLYYRV